MTPGYRLEVDLRYLRDFLWRLHSHGILLRSRNGLHSRSHRKETCWCQHASFRQRQDLGQGSGGASKHLNIESRICFSKRAEGFLGKIASIYDWEEVYDCPFLEDPYTPGRHVLVPRSPLGLPYIRCHPYLDCGLQRCQCPALPTCPLFLLGRSSRSH